MIVFKNYFKIVKKHIGIIIMFSAIAIGISIANTSYDNSADKYVSSMPKIAIFNNDSSQLTENFVQYMSKNSEVIEIENTKKSIQDALYNNKVDSIIIIPQNFSKNLLSGEDVDIEIKKSAQNMSEQVEILTNKYFKISKFYAQVGFTEKQIIEKTLVATDNQVEVKILDGEKESLQKLALFYSFENYSFLSIFIVIIGTVMCIFNKDEIQKRNIVSSTKAKTFTKQLFLGHLCLTLVIWFIYVLVSFILYKELMLTLNALFLVINSLIFAITVTSLAYVIATFIKKENVISGIQNVLSLGLSFISGCFVPVEFLDKNIVNFSKIFPSYWFVKGNYEIVKISEFNLENLTPILINYGIIIGFGILYFGLSKVKKH